MVAGHLGWLVRRRKAFEVLKIFDWLPFCQEGVETGQLLFHFWLVAGLSFGRFLSLSYSHFHLTHLSLSPAIDGAMKWRNAGELKLADR